MEKRSAEVYAYNLMTDHDLIREGWAFVWTNNRTRVGECNYRTKTLGVSLRFLPHMTEERFRNTMLHEIAHALVGWRAGHGALWRAKALSIGCDGQRCANVGREVAEAVSKWRVECSHGDLLGFTNRKTQRLSEGLCRCHRSPIVFIPNAR